MIAGPSSWLISPCSAAPDVDTGFWARSGVDRWAVWLIARRQGARPAVAAMTHRATELSLGLGEQL
jgi:hypothetical protein